MSKKSTNFILIISVILLIVLFGSFFYLINVIKNKNKHISAVSATLQEKINEKDNMVALENKIIELGDTHKQISGYLIDTSNIDTFVEYLEGLGVSNNISLTVKSVETPKGEKNKLNFNIEMDGSFPNVTKVVSILENSPYNMSINSLYINKITKDSSMETVDPKSKKMVTITTTKSSWQATANFTVLSF